MVTIQVGLSTLRARRRLSQRQLAALAGVRPDTISALERGDSHGIQFDTLARLCEALECGPGELLLIDQHDGHVAPVPGGPDEDEIIAQRLAELERTPAIDGPAFLAALLERAGMDPETAALMPPGAGVPPDTDPVQPTAQSRAPIGAGVGRARA